MDYRNTCTLFPRVVLLNIYYYLDTKSLFNCSLVSKHFNKLFDSDILWDKLVCDHYGGSYNDLIKVHYNINSPRAIYKIIGDLLIVNKLFNLRKTVEELINLGDFDISNNKKTILSYTISTIKDLPKKSTRKGSVARKMKLPQGSATRSLPKEIGSLINLRTLNLSKNKLTELPKEIGSLVNLQTLYLYDNNLTELPEEIGLLVNLQTLYLNDNQLVELHKEIGCLTNLQRLYLHNNKLTELPKEIESLVNLRDFSVSKNKLTSLPKEIGSLANLQIINLYCNKLTELPKEIGSLVNLRILDLRSNHLTSLPKEIGSLINLRDLSVKNNKLTDLPKEIESLTGLRDVCLSNNKFIKMSRVNSVIRISNHTEIKLPIDARVRI